MSHQIEPRVVVNPNIMFGKPVVAGTRIPVEVVLDYLAVGESIDDVLVGYPRLTREAVLAALRYAADVLRQAALSAPDAPEASEAEA